MNPEMHSLRDLARIAADHGLGAALSPLSVVLRAHGRLVGGDPLVTYALVLGQVPGAMGEYLRSAFYRRSLRRCGWALCIGFGSYVRTAEVEIGDNVQIGAYCSIGRCRIGHDVVIHDHVSIVDPRENPTADEDGGEVAGYVEIGSGARIGTGARVLASVGAGAIVAPGSVVISPVPRRPIY